MIEKLTEPNYEHAVMRALAEIIDRYFPDDQDFLLEFDEEELMGYLYGALLEAGEDPEEVFKTFGVTEVSHEI